MKLLSKFYDRLSGKERRAITFFIAIFILIAPTLCITVGNTAGAGLLIAAGALALLALRFYDVTEFNVLGYQAKLQKSIDEANATIIQLRQLAAALSGPIIIQLVLSGQFMRYQTLPSKQDAINTIIDCLKGIGLPMNKLGSWSSHGKIKSAGDCK